ncbi:Isoleucine--tRNA ligase [Sphingomonas sp. EC-HK361]|uniref:isoleucine--tRNA ligase n=1 Tax=Sphingomonas sp. EC-HK361 TaxID=2038397 RepID=UPI0012519757|nr:isoleucine--tRNA ligase [Sphingomonas sp. EC-HK361]VVT24970.1 Isoleucine--tRNA ligase [Sphingomonas sp. EC-HK361]
MTDTTDTPQRDWRDTVFLPKTDFPMKAGLPQKEPAILAKWQAANLYDRLRDARRGREKFILHDGPPYANGDMHIGHALNHILKDMVVRTQSLLGKDAPYVPGWDCHGLPIEWKVEEEYRKKKRSKDDVPADEFRAECRAYAQKWVDIQREQLKRLGINGDWDHPYLTMDFQAEATIVTELMKFAESDQLYRGAKPVMWSPVEKTALAEAEVEYEDITSTQIDVAFEIVEAPNAPELVGAHAVIWTTTPWTIPVNQALAYGPEIEYRLCRKRQDDGRQYLIALDLIGVTEARVGNLVPIQAIKGSQLAGAVARHPIYNFLRHPGEGRGPASSSGAGEGSGSPDQVRSEGEWERALAFFAKPRPFLPGDFVTTDAGTGLVHMAPDHGEDDFELCKAYGIDPVFAVEADGKYRADWAWLGGQGSVINTRFVASDGPICSDLRAAGGLLAASDDFRHSYPHSWRSKAKVIFRCTPQWFVSMDRPLSQREREGAAEPRKGEGGTADVAHSPSPRAAAQLAPLPPGEGIDTLRTRAIAAIADTKFYPEKGRNRIGAMVEGRPDWVLSRQRAWGVPITLFVDRKTGKYLKDPAVNARIIAAVRAGGVDAWSDARAQEYLGEAYRAEDFERVTDILDVWFDSGCTHAFVLESGRWPDLTWPANLYLEGSDQHRGWFQSSLLESCGTRGRAPYDAVLTHGFTMDSKGMKMSKSLGNTINPLDLMRDYGADILRLWALSVDFTEDHRIGKEILAGVADQYRKLRNTFRYLLGALDGFSKAERVAPADMPELERYVLHLLRALDVEMKAAVEGYDFNRYVRALTDFANEDLSAFFFDIRKDSLYCDAADDPKRRAYRTVLDTLFHALVRYAAPVLVFTAEEVWQTRYPDAESVHLLEWPELPAATADDNAVAQRWLAVRALRERVTESIEPLRREKTVRSSLEAEVVVPDMPLDADALAEAFIVAKVSAGDSVDVIRTDFLKCGRCWRHLPEVSEDGALCARCESVVSEVVA